MQDLQASNSQPEQANQFVQVDPALLQGIIEQRNTHHHHICKIIAALPVLLSELPKIQWLKLISTLGIDIASLFSPFGKKKGVNVSTEQLQDVLGQILKDHPHLQTPVTDLVNFYTTYQNINGEPTEPAAIEQ